MNRKHTITLIIATYNWPEALRMCLESVFRQTRLPDAVFIADDGSDARTAQVVQTMCRRAHFPIVHFRQLDKGFRKARILNHAIAAVETDYVVQIDGDVIPHRRFIEDHQRMAEKGCFVRGTRASLTPKETDRMLTKGTLSVAQKICVKMRTPANALRLPSWIAAGAMRKAHDGHKVKGCNMAFWRNDLWQVNGYDNRLSGWGHEDEELSCRLVNAGVAKKIVKLHAVVFHLYHSYLSRKEETNHRTRLDEVVADGLTVTPKGIQQLTTDTQ